MSSIVQARLDRVGIIMMSALGDAVHTLPVVTAIRRHSPASHITWVLQPGPAELVRGHQGVDDIILFDRKRGVQAFLDARRALRRRRFDLLLGLQVYLKAGILTGFAHADVKLGFDRARARCQLALHDAPYPCPPDTARAGSVLRVPPRTRHPARARRVGHRALEP